MQAEWAESLSPVSFEAGLEAIREFRDGGRREAPTPGEIFREAAAIDKRAEDERRRKVRKLEVVSSLEERQRNIAKLRELIKSVSGDDAKKAEPAAVQAEAAPRVAVAPDAETLRAQEIIMQKRCELRIGGA